MKTLVYIAIGSNLHSPLKQVNKAIEALNNINQSQVVFISSYYRTKPLGLSNQEDYLNAVVALKTNLIAETLLNEMQRIELQQGRVRKTDRWGPRTIDLDLLLFGNQIIQKNYLHVPHYDMKNRGFVLWPLFEIAPTLCFPHGEMLSTILVNLKEKKPPYW